MSDSAMTIGSREVTIHYQLSAPDHEDGMDVVLRPLLEELVDAAQSICVDAGLRGVERFQPSLRASSSSKGEVRSDVSQ
jgi:hypothetical protein